MNYEFKILTFTNDSSFSMMLAKECDKYGFILSFIENIEEIALELNNTVIAVSLIDLNEEEIDPFELSQFIKKDYGLPVFGVLNKFSKSIQDKAKKNGFDLIFTKNMLLRSIREVVVHVSKE